MSCSLRSGKSVILSPCAIDACIVTSWKSEKQIKYSEVGEGREEREKRENNKVHTQRKILTMNSCLNNWGKLSREMESESIVIFVKKNSQEVRMLCENYHPQQLHHHASPYL